MILVPSRFEPCGLTQMYGLRYGTVPVVRRVGGLADTVRDTGSDAPAGNGFVFDGAHPEALRDAIARACVLYRVREGWTKLMRTGMGESLSWDGPARQYMALYEQAHGARRGALRQEID
jgi:starch synthase